MSFTLINRTRQMSLQYQVMQLCIIATLLQFDKFANCLLSVNMAMAQLFLGEKIGQTRSFVLSHSQYLVELVLD